MEKNIISFPKYIDGKRENRTLLWKWQTVHYYGNGKRS
ncbi:Protein of unknown function [Bacillus wiedmannii]|nr:Protein of unknown function [Bacillus wiedmannii]